MALLFKVEHLYNVSVEVDLVARNIPKQDLKVCTTCGVPKQRSTSDFHRSSRHRGGFQTQVGNYGGGFGTNTYDPYGNGPTYAPSSTGGTTLVALSSRVFPSVETVHP